jgi:hypothetical protein
MVTIKQTLVVADAGVLIHCPAVPYSQNGILNSFTQVLKSAAMPV